MVVGLLSICEIVGFGKSLASIYKGLIKMLICKQPNMSS